MRKLVLAVAAIVLSSCASMRGVDYGNAPGGNFAVEVTNSRGSTVTMAYTAGTNRIQLGTVAASRTERFIIPGAAGSSVTVTAVSSGGSTVGTFPVTIQPGTTQRITVR